MMCKSQSAIEITQILSNAIRMDLTTKQRQGNGNSPNPRLHHYTKHNLFYGLVLRRIYWCRSILRPFSIRQTEGRIGVL